VNSLLTYLLCIGFLNKALKKGFVFPSPKL
jgi:hypothetical protein